MKDKLVIHENRLKTLEGKVASHQGRFTSLEATRTNHKEAIAIMGARLRHHVAVLDSGRGSMHMGPLNAEAHSPAAIDYPYINPDTHQILIAKALQQDAKNQMGV